MKKLPGLLLLILVAFQPGCKKSDVTLPESNGHVIDGGAIAADGRGFYIHVDNTGENVFPINLPSSYQQTNVNAAVAVKFVDIGKKFYWGYRIGNDTMGGMRGVYIITIRKI